MFNGDGGGAMTGNNDVINNNKRTAVVYATEAGELYTVESERKYLLGSFKSDDTKLVRHGQEQRNKNHFTVPNNPADVINNNKRTAVVYDTEAGELYTVASEWKYLLGSFKSGYKKSVRP